MGSHHVHNRSLFTLRYLDVLWSVLKPHVLLDELLTETVQVDIRAAEVLIEENLRFFLLLMLGLGLDYGLVDETTKLREFLLVGSLPFLRANEVVLDFLGFEIGGALARHEIDTLDQSRGHFWVEHMFSLVCFLEVKQGFNLQLYVLELLIQVHWDEHLCTVLEGLPHGLEALGGLVLED